MADTQTLAYHFILPEVGGSDDTWGDKLNADLQQLDGMLAGAFEAPAVPDGTLGKLKETAYGTLATLAGASPILTFHETDQVAPKGKWRFVGSGGDIIWQRNTAVAMDFSTNERAFEFGSTVDAGGTAPIYVGPLTRLEFKPRTGVGLPGIYPGPGDQITLGQSNLTGTVVFTANLITSTTIPTGLRMRFGGSGGTGGGLQLSGGDTGFINLVPGTALLSAFSTAGEAGLVFAQGIKITNANAGHLGATAGNIAMIPVGAGSQSCDLGFVANEAAATYSYRFGRYGLPGTTHQILVVDPGSSTTMIRARSDGYFEAKSHAQIGDSPIRIGATQDNVINGVYISLGGSPTFGIQTTATSSNPMCNFRNGPNDLVAQVGQDNTSLSQTYMLATRAKGDNRWALSSSARFKEGVVAAVDAALVTTFGTLPQVKTWTWGGELDPRDERVGRPGFGFIAEEVEAVYPAAVRYQWLPAPQPGPDAEITGIYPEETEQQVWGLDPMAMIALLVAKLRDHEARLAVLEP